MSDDARAAQIGAEKSGQRAGSDAGGKRGGIHHGAEITGTALPAFNVRVTVGAASTESLSWLTASVAGRPLEAGKARRIGGGDGGRHAAAGGAATMRAPGYGSPLTSVNCTATFPEKGLLTACRSVSCAGAATCTRANAIS